MGGLQKVGNPLTRLLADIALKRGFHLHLLAYSKHWNNHANRKTDEAMSRGDEVPVRSSPGRGGGGPVFWPAVFVLF